MPQVNFTGSLANVTVTESPNQIVVTEDGVVVANLTTTTSIVDVTSPVNTITITDTVDPLLIRSYFSADAPLQYDAVNGIFSIDENALFSGKTTDDLAEGSTNLYFTEQRVIDAVLNNGLDFNAEKVDDRVANLLQNSSTITFVYDDVANTLTPHVSLTSFTTDDVAEGSTNLYYTETRATNNFNSNFSSKTTDDLAQGTINLYYSDERVDDRVANLISSGSANVTFTYNDVANTLVLTHSLTTDDISEGNNLYFTDARVVNAVNTNEITLKHYHETLVDLGNVSGIVNIDLSTGTVFKMVMIDHIEGFNITNDQPGSSFTLILQQDATGGRLFEKLLNPQYWTDINWVNAFEDLDLDPNTYTTINAYVSAAGVKYFSLSRYDETLPGLETTDNLAEGTTNLYYTDARARNAISVAGDLAYNPTTGVISYTTPPEFDNQTLSFDTGTYSLSISNGNSVDLTALTEATDKSPKYITAYRVATNPLNRGDYVMINKGGSYINNVNGYPPIDLASSAEPAWDVEAVIGIAEDNFPNPSDEGRVCVYGPMTGLDLTGFSIGDEISVTDPVSGDKMQIGWVTQGGNPGAIFVDPKLIKASTVTGNVSIDSAIFNTTQNIDPVQGQLTWNPDKSTLALGLNGVELNLGQDQLIYAKATESIAKGDAVMFAGAEGSHLLIRKADVTVPGFIDQWIIGIAKEAFALNDFGFVQVFGTITSMNTSTYTLGDILYLDIATPGALTTTAPSAPGHVILMAAVTNVHATQGEIFVRATYGEHIEDLYNVDIVNLAQGDILTYDGVTGTWKNNEVLKDLTPFFNGVFVGHPEVSVESNGTIVEAVLTGEGTTDIQVFWSDGVTTIDTTPPIRVTLTHGTDTVPVLNYVFIPKSTGVLTAGTYWPENVEFVPVATVMCPSPTYVQNDGVYKLHSWTDHVNSSAAKGSMGHLHHLNYWIRQQPATWHEGVSSTINVVTQPSAPDNVFLATTAGEILQLHENDFPAFDFQTGSHGHIVNHPTTPYLEIGDLNNCNIDSSGNTIGNNNWTNLVIWGVVSSHPNECQIMVNLPSAFHTSESAALNDAQGFTNYSLPNEYLGTAFLIARITLKYTNASGGTWSLAALTDLRGATSGSIAGSAIAPTGTVFPDTLFRVVDTDDESKALALDIGAVTTSTTRTLTVPDHDGTIITTSSSTTDLPEGTNLYYTDARVKTAVQTAGSSVNGFYMDQVFNGVNNERQFTITNDADTNPVSVGNIGYAVEKIGIPVTTTSVSFGQMGDHTMANQLTSWDPLVTTLLTKGQKTLFTDINTYLFEDGESVEIANVDEGAWGGVSINGTYYIKKHVDVPWMNWFGNANGTRIYALYTDAALTTPALWSFGEAWPFGNGLFFPYNFDGISGDVRIFKGTNNRWDFVMPEGDNAFTFRHNGNDIFRIEDDGQITGFTTDNLAEGTTNLFTTETNVHSFVGTYRGDIFTNGTVSANLIKGRNQIIEASSDTRLDSSEISNINVRAHRVDNTGTEFTFYIASVQNGYNAGVADTQNPNNHHIYDIASVATGAWANANLGTTLGNDHIVYGITNGNPVIPDAQRANGFNINWVGLTLDSQPLDGITAIYNHFTKFIGTFNGIDYYSKWGSQDLTSIPHNWGMYGVAAVNSDMITINPGLGSMSWDKIFMPEDVAIAIFRKDPRSDEQHFRIPDGTAVTIAGTDFTGVIGRPGKDMSPVGTQLNNTYYVKYSTITTNDEYYYGLYTDPGLTIPVTFPSFGLETVPDDGVDITGQFYVWCGNAVGGTATYTATSTVTDLRWDMRINATDDNLHFASNDVDAATLTPTGDFTASNVSVTGTVTAATFIGDGSQLTGITAGGGIDEAQFVVLLKKYMGLINIVDGGTSNDVYDGGDSATTVFDDVLDGGGIAALTDYNGGDSATTVFDFTADGGDSSTVVFDDTVNGGAA